MECEECFSNRSGNGSCLNEPLKGLWIPMESEFLTINISSKLGISAEQVASGANVRFYFCDSYVKEEKLHWQECGGFGEAFSLTGIKPNGEAAKCYNSWHFLRLITHKGQSKRTDFINI